MNLALIWLGILWALMAGGKKAPAQPSPATPPSPGPPAPWPAALPSGLPPFPGSGWEYDEPPPVAVQMRAKQLLDALWAKGKGSHQVEQTAGRWIVYRAEITRGNKRGVVAYREKRTAPAPAPRPAPARPAPAPAPVAPPRSPTAAPRPAPQPVVHVGPARVEPAVAPTSSLTLPTLRKGWGAKPAPPHPDVKLLQQKLGIPADGRFWTDTDKAVREFQRRKGLEVDGVVGPATWTALFAVKAA